MASKQQPRADLDSPWKEALDLFLAPFLSLFYPSIHAEIDWERGYEILDKELLRISQAARVGRRLADKLFKVWLRDGQEAWLLIHIEVQGRKEPGFTERMFIYSYRIYDRYRKPVVSLAVLCDDDPDWRPDRFGYERWGSSHDFRFLMVKLIDLRSDEAALESNRNVFAPIVLAQLKASETRRTPDERRRWKVRLVKGLYDRGLSAEKVRQLFRLIDWMMELPKDQELEFRAEIDRFEEDRKMPYVTSVERLAREEGERDGWEKGQKEGLREGILLALEVKFGEASHRLLAKIQAIQDVNSLQAVAHAIKSARNLDEMERVVG
ncbi:MAG: hypothetical protein HY815_09615 [Candidatus Riflebacteria bacterium]|nr:hypothetical protein [Candidatus Riflebacteria bacterium]